MTREDIFYLKDLMDWNISNARENLKDSACEREERIPIKEEIKSYKRIIKHLDNLLINKLYE